MTSNMNQKARLNADLHQKMIEYMAMKYDHNGQKVNKVASVAKPAHGKNKIVSPLQKAANDRDKSVTKASTATRVSDVSTTSATKKVEKGIDDFELIGGDEELREEYGGLGEEPEEDFVLIEDEYDEYEVVAIE